VIGLCDNLAPRIYQGGLFTAPQQMRGALRQGRRVDIINLANVALSETR
jgi:hypothetical protein